MRRDQPLFIANWSLALLKPGTRGGLSLAYTVGIAIAYFLAARVGLALLADDVGVFWPASGIAVGILVVMGPRVRVPVVIGVVVATIIANLVADRSVWASIFKGVCNAGEAVFTAWLIERWFGRPFAFDDIRHVLGFVAAAGLGSAASALGGAATVALMHSTVPFWEVWWIWFMASVVGILVVAPVLIGLGQLWSAVPSRAGTVEGLGILSVVPLASWYAVAHPTGSWLSFDAAAVVFPLLLWLTARCEPVFAMAAAFIWSITVICATAFGIGHFGDVTMLLAERVSGAQVAILLVTLCALVLTALFTERRRNESALKLALLTEEEIRTRLADAMTGGQVMAFEWDSRTGLSRHDDGAHILGFEQGGMAKATQSNFLSHVHPDDRANVKARIRGLRPDHPSYASAFRFRRPDGREVWLEETARGEFDAKGRLLRIKGLTRDVTERRRTEGQLAEREAQLRLFIEHAPATIAVFDREMRYLAVSRRFAIDLRLPRDVQLIGMSHYEVFPEVPQRWRDIHVRVLAGEELSSDEDQFTRLDGRTEWMGWSMAPWREADGRIGGAVLFAEMRTEQVEARRALADSEARFRATFENAAVGVVLVGVDGLILRANNSLAQMLGYSVEELTTRTFQELTHPDDLANNLSVLNKTAAGEAESFCIEKRYVAKDGSIVWASASVSCVRKADSTIDYLIVVIQDIRDRKQAEAGLAERNAQLDLALKAARVGSYSSDITAGTLRISCTHAAVHSVSPNPMEVTLQQWWARVHRDDIQRVRAEHIRAFKERRCDLVNEFRFVLPGGEVRWVEARSLIAYGDSGRAQRMTGVYIDVTERRIGEEHKNLLIAELDHRVKNVLACVAAVAQQSRECSRSADHFLDVLNGRINSLANAHALLSRSRWEGVGVDELVRSELARCTNDGNHLVEGPDMVLTAEATQSLAMVLHELTTNATKYGALSNRCGRVSVRWGRHSSSTSKECLALEWHETGGPPIAAQGPCGYGSSVIRDLIPYELGGSVDYVLAPEGVRCRVELPAKWLRYGNRDRADQDKAA